MRASQLYGYAVCLIAVVTGLVSLNKVVDSGFELADPLHAFRGDPAMASYEVYRASFETGRAAPGRPTMVEPGQTAAVPDDQSLRRMWEATRDERIASARRHAMKELTKSVLLLLAAVALFASHWLWLRRERATPTVSP